ncbi:hypothetical protein HZ326_29597 [Fusarium oxysporum f. sp. albedinis]|nr:hypothetical protein HZ326_29597 [Fusarium oxysporum f. sp. albedinis]
MICWIIRFSQPSTSCAPVGDFRGLRPPGRKIYIRTYISKKREKEGEGEREGEIKEKKELPLIFPSLLPSPPT